jgi:S1-C subfamily serine protease
VPLHRRLVRFHKLAAETGILVLSVEPGSPAARAGVIEGDVVIELDGKPMRGIDDLQRQLTDERVGVPVPLIVVRKTEKLDLMVTPAESKPLSEA